VSLSVRRLCGVVAHNSAQVALMDVVPSAVAALEAHLGIEKVAKSGLGFLHNLCIAPENKVTPQWCRAVCAGVRLKVAVALLLSGFLL
jgi:hypothetical protein